MGIRNCTWRIDTWRSGALVDDVMIATEHDDPKVQLVLVGDFISTEEKVRVAKHLARRLNETTRND